MSRLSTPSNSPDPVAAVRDPANAPLVEFVLKAAKAIQRTELAVAVLGWLVTMVLGVLGLVLVDHWLWPLNGLARYGAWTALVFGSVGWTVGRVVPLLGRTINPQYAAQRIEAAIPEMKEGLISWLQLASTPERVPRSVLNTIGRYVFRHLHAQDAQTIVDHFLPVKMMLVLLGSVLVGSVYLMVSPKSGMATLQRLLLPWAEIAPATRVRILEVRPGHTTVTEGKNLPVAITVRGWHRQDKAAIVYSTDDGQITHRPIAMQADIEGVTYVAELGASFGGISQPLHYEIHAGDAIAGPFAVKVQAVPLAVIERVEYRYPPYTRLATKVLEDDGRVKGPEGTQVHVWARTNQVPQRGRIEFDLKPTPDEPFQVSRADDLLIEPLTISAKWMLAVDESRSNPTLQAYRLRYENALGELNNHPVVYPIKVIPDLPPEVELASGLAEEVELPVNGSLDIAVRASDPDFGLVRLYVQAAVDGRPVAAKELFRNDEGFIGQVQQSYVLEPQKVRLQPGQKVEFVAIAEDNRHAGEDQHAEANVRQSRKLTVMIVPPQPMAAATPREGQPADAKSISKAEGAPPASLAKGKSDSEAKSGEASENRPPRESTTEVGDSGSASADSGQGITNPKEKPTGASQTQSASNRSEGSSHSESSQPSRNPDGAEAGNSAAEEGSGGGAAGGSSSAGGESQAKSDGPRDAGATGDQPQHDGDAFENLREWLENNQGAKEGSARDGKAAAGDGQADRAQDGSQGQSDGASAVSSSGGGDADPKASSGETSRQSGSPAADSSGTMGSQGDANNSQPSTRGEGTQPASAGDSDSKSLATRGEGGADRAPTDTEKKTQPAAQGNASATGSSQGSQEGGRDSAGKQPAGTDSAVGRTPIPGSPEPSVVDRGPTTARNPAAPVTPRGEPGASGNVSSGTTPTPGAQAEHQADQVGEGVRPAGDRGEGQTSVEKKPADRSSSNEGPDSADANRSSAKASGKLEGSDQQGSHRYPSGEAGEERGKSKPQAQRQAQNDSEDQQRSHPEDVSPSKSQGGVDQRGSLGSQDPGMAGQDRPGEAPSTDPSGSNPSAGGQAGGERNANQGPGEDASDSSSADQQRASPSEERIAAPEHKAASQATSGDGGKSPSASMPASQQSGSGGETADAGEGSSSSDQGLGKGGASLRKTEGNVSGKSRQGGDDLSESSSSTSMVSPAEQASAETDYARQATDLILQALQRERDQPDPELLQRMGWSKEQLQAFVDRWMKAKEEASRFPEKKREYDEALRSLGLTPSAGRTRQADGRNDGLQGMREEGGRIRPPESLRERFDAFRKARR